MRKTAAACGLAVLVLSGCQSKGAGPPVEVSGVYGAARMPDPAWITTGSMATDRIRHTATLLSDGKVLVTGGRGSQGIVRTAETYDPDTGSWQTAASMAVDRRNHFALRLHSGLILVAGGASPASAELYDPSTQVWRSTGAPMAERQGATATLLASGKVLVAGGEDAGYFLQATAEIYDPAAETWSPVASMSAGRYRAAAVPLPDGTVVVAGGTMDGAALAERYDPGADTWTATGPMQVDRWDHAALLLPSGKILVVCGNNGADVSLGAELFDPLSGAWTPTGPVQVARENCSATLLPGGQVLVAGGVDPASAELYDPIADRWTDAGTLGISRYDHSATMLATGKVLLEGGAEPGCCNGLVSAELYQAGTPGWSATGAAAEVRTYHSATLLPDGTVLVTGGSGSAPPASVELFTPATGGWGAVASMSVPRSGHTATLLPGGLVLVAGGAWVSQGGAWMNSKTCELYELATGVWRATGSMATGRSLHTATLLPSGKVLVARGSGDGGAYLASAELYDPATGTWSPTGSLADSSEGHTATLLADGRVLVAGGYRWGVLGSAELYDPNTGTWRAAGAMTTGRHDHRATLLPGGKVLVSGGIDKLDATLGSAELYDPAAGSNGAWSVTGSMAEARFGHSTTLLRGGQVLALGGASAELYDPLLGTWSPVATAAPAPAGHLAVPLPDGRVLAVGGSQVASLFDDGLAPLTAAVPTISTPPSQVACGDTLTLSGTGFRGISEASTGGGSSPTNYPLVRLRTNESARSFAPVEDFSDGSLRATIPAAVQPGPAWLSVVISGVPSAERAIDLTCGLAITPAAVSLPPRGTMTFTTTGGSGAGAAWSLTASPSGGQVGPSTGVYTAGASGGVTDVVQARDSFGLVASREITVTVGVSIAPAVATVASGRRASFSASGGSGVGFEWSIKTNSSGGVVTGAGEYQAGPIHGGVDTLQVRDSLGNTALAEVTVTARPPPDNVFQMSCSQGGVTPGALALLALLALATPRRRTARGALLLAAVLAAGPASAAEPTRKKPAKAIKVVVVPITAGLGFDPKLAEAMTTVVVAELAGRGIQVATPKDVETSLNIEHQKQMMGCSKEECLTELAGALGTDLVVSGNMAAVGKYKVITVQLFNAREGAVERTFQEHLVNAESEDLLDAAERAGEELFPGTKKSGSGPKRRTLLAAAPERPLALELGAFYEPTGPGGMASLLLTWRLDAGVRLSAGPAITGSQNVGAAMQVAWVPFQRWRLAPYVAVGGVGFFTKETVFGATAAVGVEWAITERFSLAAHVPVVWLLEAPPDHKTSYLMPGVVAGWAL